MIVMFDLNSAPITFGAGILFALEQLSGPGQQAVAEVLGPPSRNARIAFELALEVQALVLRSESAKPNRGSVHAQAPTAVFIRPDTHHYYKIVDAQGKALMTGMDSASTAAWWARAKGYEVQ